MHLLRGPVFVVMALGARFGMRPILRIVLFLVRHCAKPLRGVSVISCDGDVDEQVTKLSDALRVLDRECPAAVRRLPTDVRVIWVIRRDMKGGVHYAHSARAIQLSGRFVREKGPKAISAAILFAATQARLRSTVAGYSLFAWDRVETAAARRTKRLLAKLQGV